MEEQAKEYILRDINSFINNKATITNEIKTFEIESGKDSKPCKLYRIL